MLLADVSLADLIWTSIWIFFLIMFIWLFIAIVGDLFRDHELSGGMKALWVIGLIVFPLIGSLAYLLIRGQGMGRRSMAQAQETQAQVDSYIRATASSTGTASVDDLTRLAELRANGTVTEEEFEAMKARIVSGRSAA
jgi:hypothetical protein